jgi:hypothetical protein
LFTQNRELINSIEFSGNYIDVSSPHYVDGYNPIGHIRDLFSQFSFLAVKFSMETTYFNFHHDMESYYFPLNDAPFKLDDLKTEYGIYKVIIFLMILLYYRLLYSLRKCRRPNRTFYIILFCYRAKKMNYTFL